MIQAGSRWWVESAGFAVQYAVFLLHVWSPAHKPYFSGAIITTTHFWGQGASLLRRLLLAAELTRRRCCGKHE